MTKIHPDKVINEEVKNYLRKRQQADVEIKCEA